MTKVDNLTMCLKDIAVRYGLEFNSHYNTVDDELVVLYERYDYTKRRNEAKSFHFNKATILDIEKILNETESILIMSLNLKEKKTSFYLPKIKNVIFNDPATIVFWEDGTKTVVKAQDEEFDPEKGLAMAISKKALGNQGNYCNEFKKWVPEEKDAE